MHCLCKHQSNYALTFCGIILAFVSNRRYLFLDTVSLKHTARYFSRLALSFRFEISIIHNVHSKISETHERCLALRCSTQTGGIIKIDNQNEKHLAFCEHFGSVTISNQLLRETRLRWDGHIVRSYTYTVALELGRYRMCGQSDRLK